MSATKVSVPAKPTTLDLDVRVQFVTAKGNHYDIKIGFISRRASELGLVEEVSVSINAEKPTLMLTLDFIKKMYVINKFYGMKDITRSACGMNVEEYESFYEYTEHWKDNMCPLFWGKDVHDEYDPPCESDKDNLYALFGLRLNVELY